MRPDVDLLAILAAILISGTTHTPEEGVAKAKAVIAAAKAATKEEDHD